MSTDVQISLEWVAFAEEESSPDCEAYCYITSTECTKEATHILQVKYSSPCQCRTEFYSCLAHAPRLQDSLEFGGWRCRPHKHNMLPVSIRPLRS